jgi:hypothetical protein
VTSSAFEPPWETSWHNQDTGVDKGSKHRPIYLAGVRQEIKKRRNERRVYKKRTNKIRKRKERTEV